MPGPWEKYQGGQGQPSGPWEKYGGEPLSPQPDAMEMVGSAIKGGIVTPLKSLGETVKGVLAPPDNTKDHISVALAGPLGPLVRRMVESKISEGSQAFQNFRQGNIREGVAHTMGALPIPGTEAAVATGRKFAQSVNEDNPNLGAEAIGEFASYVAPGVAKAVEPAQGLRLSPRMQVHLNPVEQAALDWGKARNMPVDAWMETGNEAALGLEKVGGQMPGGVGPALRAKAAREQWATQTADDLMNQAHPKPQVPETAGQAVRGSLDKKMTGHAENANTSYESFRHIEQQTPMPVDISAIKAQLKPIYEDMVKWMEPAKRNASAGFTAIESILYKKGMHGVLKPTPDIIPASQAEAGLGGLKQLAREGAGRNSGLAKFVVPKLQKAIDDAVSAVDRQALIELNAGRAEAAAQYGTQAVLDKLRTEPVQTFGQMTYAKDAGIDLIRKVQQEAPGELRKVGRAFLDRLFDKAEAGGGFSGADGMWKEWRNLGAETKKLLYPNPLLREGLDNFFLNVKRMGANANPSNTAAVSGLLGLGKDMIRSPFWTTGQLLLRGKLTEMLYTPKGARLLTQGLRLPPGSTAAAMNRLEIMSLADGDKNASALAK